MSRWKNRSTRKVLQSSFVIVLCQSLEKSGSQGDFRTKRYDVKECAMRGVYWVNLKFKDCKSMDASLYTYLCLAICISVDGCILWQA